MTPPSTPKRDPNPFARQSIWPPMPKTSFRVPQPAAPAPPPSPPPKPARGSIYATSAVPMPLRRAPEESPAAEAHPAPRPLPQTAPPIPPARPMPDGPTVAAADRPRQAQPRPGSQSGPPLLALAAAGLVGVAGLGVLFLLLGRQAPAPALAANAPAPRIPRSATSLSVGQVISPLYPDLRGPMAAQNAEQPPQSTPAPVLVTAAPSSPAPAAIAAVVQPSVVQPPRTADAARPAPDQALAAATRAPPRTAAPLPRLTGPVSDEPFLTVTTRRIGPSQAASAPTAAYDPPSPPRAMVAPPMPYRQSYPPVLGYVRPAPADPDAPIVTRNRDGQ